jgi:hypothetical protein
MQPVAMIVLLLATNAIAAEYYESATAGSHRWSGEPCAAVF